MKHGCGTRGQKHIPHLVLRNKIVLQPQGGASEDSVKDGTQATDWRARCKAACRHFAAGLDLFGVWRFVSTRCDRFIEGLKASVRLLLLPSFQFANSWEEMRRVARSSMSPTCGLTKPILLPIGFCTCHTPHHTTPSPNLRADVRKVRHFGAADAQVDPAHHVAQNTLSILLQFTLSQSETLVPMQIDILTYMHACMHTYTWHPPAARPTRRNFDTNDHTACGESHYVG